ncbi:MAG: hypothetical protein JW768_11240 [Chitinispirillaceae bacterium]|nr:hypothetical protein [Chitinispirillaceae bacterium]
METSPRKPKLLINFVLALLVILAAFALDTRRKHLEAEGKTAETAAADTTGLKDTAAVAVDTADTAADTDARPRPGPRK